jgi:hypothetical protein
MEKVETRSEAERKKISKGVVLIIIGVIGMIASLIWEILAGGDEAVIVSVYTTAMVIIGFLWIMNDTIRDNNRLLMENSRILAELNRTLVELRDVMRKK